MLVRTRELLLDAKNRGYAVGAFNVENAEMMAAVVAAADEQKAPVILQTTPSTLKYLSPQIFAAIARGFASTTVVPIALHLDHGNGIAIVEKCIQFGYTSVMIDGSALPYEENVTLTRQVCEIAAMNGVSVEAELGIVGGKEDNTEADMSQYTDPEQAADFVQRTGVDSLAISIGTAHGFYVSTPVLDLSRISLIRKVLDAPLVLHGASGVPDEVIEEAVRLGISKVNFATELRDAYTKAVRAYLLADSKVYDPKKYGVAAMEAVKQLVARKIRICNCDGKA